MQKHRIPENEIFIGKNDPLLHEFDLDDSKGLSTTELQKMRDEDVLYILKYGEPSTDSIDSVKLAVAVFNELKPETRTYVLRALGNEQPLEPWDFSLTDNYVPSLAVLYYNYGFKFSGELEPITDKNRENAFINRLATENLERLVDDLARHYDRDADYLYQDQIGLHAHTVLQGVDDAIKIQIMTKMAESYPNFAKRVASWDKLSSNSNYAVQNSELFNFDYKKPSYPLKHCLFCDYPTPNIQSKK